VKQGEVRQVRFHDYVIRETEKRDGVVLLCCCTAQTDLTIEAGEAGGPDDIPLQHVRARLYHQALGTEGVAVVKLHVMRGQMLRFLAGQHVCLKLSGTKALDLSIASCPCDGLNLEFHFDTNSSDDMSARAMAGFSRSDRFEIEGPRGRFTLDERSGRGLLFIASDTAIAPVKSIIEHAINLELPQPMFLYWHASASSDHYLHNYFRSLSDAFDEFNYLPIAGGLSAETFSKLPDPGSFDAYIAGNDAFAAGAQALLLGLGMPRERLFVDALSRRPSRAPTAD
jgi:CDP-4-dehydro-6-deoxyglucose reductase